MKIEKIKNVWYGRYKDIYVFEKTREKVLEMLLFRFKEYYDTKTICCQ